ncbi:XamI family restriction endonuclease [Ruegeria atlantica]|uniref:XamI family restriction endonuclease n=1 Tax=Ruegeria atlantica TaxID=81569 RepID=UPI001480A7A0|nr:XamI family restriction endonuclease [Ruegeria atlantica]
MSIPNVSRLPTIWTDAELEEQAQASIDAFVDRRLKEPRDRYLAHISLRQAAIMRLFKTLIGVDPKNPDVEVVREVLLDSDLLNALRYVAGPPVSENDLNVLVTRSTVRITKTRLKVEDDLVQAVLRLICSLSDPIRFPWINDRRTPAPHELKHAIRATAALHATQTLQTERRGFGRAVEKALKDRLLELGYEQMKAPNKIESPSQWPTANTFYGECAVYGRKADILIGLADGRIVAVEAKDSASALNSIKRVLNDTAAKAGHWNTKAGEGIVPVALLSGVFGVENLKSAQASGLYLVWTHELDSFVSWLLAQ